MTTTPKIHGIDAMLALADGGQYLPLLHQEARTLIENTRSHAQAYRTKAKCKLTVTIELTIDPFGQADVTAEHKLAEPKTPKAKAVAWVDEDGSLTTANPAQQVMQIREVEGRRELRSPGF